VTQEWTLSVEERPWRVLKTSLAGEGCWHGRAVLGDRASLLLFPSTLVPHRCLEIKLCLTFLLKILCILDLREVMNQPRRPCTRPSLSYSKWHVSYSFSFRRRLWTQQGTVQPGHFITVGHGTWSCISGASLLPEPSSAACLDVLCLCLPRSSLQYRYRSLCVFDRNPYVLLLH
jgi:hypothetical protein